MKGYLKWTDLIKLILSGVLVWWIYISVGWAVTVLAVVVCINDLANGIATRMQYQRDMLVFEMVTRLAERGTK